MKSQVTSSQVISSAKGKVIGVYKDRGSALKIKQAIESAGLSNQKVLIDDHVTPAGQVEAIGTTSGGEAGFLLGTLYGGFISILAATSAAYWLDIDASSTLPRLLIVGISLAGGLIGLISGKRNYDVQPKDQKQKSDPSIPRNFRVVVSGSEDEVNKAKSVVRDIEVMSAQS